MVVTATPRLISGIRNLRYGEVLLVTLGQGPPKVEVYNSFPLNDCPAELWEKLDAVALATEHGATFAFLNGPRYWLMDGIGKVDPIEPVVAEFGGIAMRRVATVQVDDFANRGPFQPVSVNRGAAFMFDAGSDGHVLTDPEGRQFIMQAYCTAVDPTLTIDKLAGLGERLTLPAGWRFATVRLADELTVDTTARPATVVQDELQNSYTLVDAGSLSGAA